MEREPHRIGYARVSTEDQNLSLQLDALRKAGCERIFCDQGLSGISANRPALKDAVANLRQGDVLVTWKLDRLGRSLVHLIHLVKDLGERQIGFSSLSESIDTTTSHGKFFFHLLGALAELERDLISERTKAGLASAKARGIRLGRPPKLTQEKFAEAREHIQSGVSDIAEVAAMVGVSPITLARALKCWERSS